MVNQQRQRALLHVERNSVPGANERQGPPTAASGATCRTTVPNAVPLIRPSEIRTMSVTPFASSLRESGCCRAPACLDSRAAQSFEDEHGIGVDLEVVAVDPGVQVLDALEHHRATSVPHERRAGGRGLDDGSSRGEVAAQHPEGILGLDRALKGADHPRIRGTAVRDALLHRPAGDS